MPPPKGKSKSGRRVDQCILHYDDSAFPALTQDLSDKIQFAFAPALGAQGLTSAECDAILKSLNWAVSDFKEHRGMLSLSTVEFELDEIRDAAIRLLDQITGPDCGEPREKWVAHRLRDAMENLGEDDYPGPWQRLVQGLKMLPLASEVAKNDIIRDHSGGKPGTYTQHLRTLMVGVEQEVFVPRNLSRTYSQGIGEPKSLLTDVTFSLAQLLPRKMRPASRGTIFALHRRLRSDLSTLR